MNVNEQRRLTALDFAIRTAGHTGTDGVLETASRYLSFIQPPRTPRARAKKAKPRR